VQRHDRSVVPRIRNPTLKPLIERRDETNLLLNSPHSRSMRLLGSPSIPSSIHGMAPITHSSAVARSDRVPFSVAESFALLHFSTALKYRLNASIAMGSTESPAPLTLNLVPRSQLGPIATGTVLSQSLSALGSSGFRRLEFEAMFLRLCV
jgi:hypothetical protein